MATSGRHLDLEIRNQIVRMLLAQFSRREIARRCGVCKRTVDKIAREQERVQGSAVRVQEDRAEIV